MVKNLPAMQETQVWSLGWEDSLEKGMATQSSILAWRIPWTDEPGRLWSMGLQRVRHNWAINVHKHTFCWNPFTSNNLSVDALKESLVSFPHFQPFFFLSYNYNAGSGLHYNAKNSSNRAKFLVDSFYQRKEVIFYIYFAIFLWKY